MVVYTMVSCAVSKEELAVVACCLLLVACRMSLVVFCAVVFSCWCHEKGAGHLCRVREDGERLHDGR